jgi:hypothetical protein
VPTWATAQQPAPANKPPNGQAAAAAAAAANLGRAFNRVRLKVNSMLNAGNFNTDRASADEFLDLRMQLFQVEGNHVELVKLRNEMKLELRRAHMADSKSAINEMNAFYLQKFQELAFGPQTAPVVRVNAMLMIGDLNEKEFDYTGKQPPVPLPAAIPVMLKAITDPQVQEAVRGTAFVGLLRHAELGVADKQVVEKQLIPALLAVAQAKQPPANASADAHVWMRRRAVEAIAALKLPGKPAEDPVKTLQAIAADKTEPLPLRCEAARALGQFAYSAPGPDAATIKSLGKLVVEVSQEDMQIRGLRYYLQCVQIAFNGPEGQPADQPKRGIAASLAPGDSKKLADGIVQKLTELQTVIETTLDPLLLPPRIKTEGTKLDEWLDETQVAAAG